MAQTATQSPSAVQTTQTMYDFYVAARYRNRDNALTLARAIRDRGNSVYFFVESRASQAHVEAAATDAEAAMRHFEARSHDDPGVRDVFESDLAALKDSSAFIMLLPAGKSCHVEAGIAYALGKHLILVGEPEATESLYLIFNERYLTTEAFLKQLKS